MKNIKINMDGDAIVFAIAIGGMFLVVIAGIVMSGLADLEKAKHSSSLAIYSQDK